MGMTMSKRFTLFGSSTPNPCKVAIALEEAGIAYTYREIDLNGRENETAWFRTISPNAKVPVLRDRDQHIWESGAILLHLSAELGSRSPALCANGPEVQSWLFFQSATVGPMLGQLYHFMHYAEPAQPQAVERFTSEVQRALTVLDRRLSMAEHLIGETFSIADMAMWPWLEDLSIFGIEVDAFPHLKRWITVVGARTSVRRAVALIYGTDED